MNVKSPFVAFLFLFVDAIVSLKKWIWSWIITFPLLHSPPLCLDTSVPLCMCFDIKFLDSMACAIHRLHNFFTEDRFVHHSCSKDCISTFCFYLSFFYLPKYKPSSHFWQFPLFHSYRTSFVETSLAGQGTYPFVFNKRVKLVTLNSPLENYNTPCGWHIHVCLLDLHLSPLWRWATLSENINKF